MDVEVSHFCIQRPDNIINQSYLEWSIRIPILIPLSVFIRIRVHLIEIQFSRVSSATADQTRVRIVVPYNT